MNLGINIGSTTIKLALLDKTNGLIYTSYQRHFSKINEKLLTCLKTVKHKFPNIESLAVSMTGSAGMGLSQGLGIDFVQEVFATKVAVNTLMPEVDTVIELGG